MTSTSGDAKTFPAASQASVIGVEAEKQSMMGPFMSSVRHTISCLVPEKCWGTRTNIFGINPSFFLFAIGELPGFDKRFLRGSFFASRVASGVGDGALAFFDLLFALEAECIYHCVVGGERGVSVAVVVSSELRESRHGGRVTGPGSGPIALSGEIRGVEIFGVLCDIQGQQYLYLGKQPRTSKMNYGIADPVTVSLEALESGALFLQQPLGPES